MCIKGKGGHNGKMFPNTIIQVTLYLATLAEVNEDTKTLSFCNAANKLQVKTQQQPFASRKTWVIMNPGFRKTED